MTAGAAPWRALPHQHPFLLVDRVLELEPGVSCTMRVLVSAGAVMTPMPLPTGLLVEMLCQTCAALRGGDEQSSGQQPAEPVPRLAGLHGFRFSRPAVPGDVLTLTVRRLRSFGSAVRFSALARAEGETLAEGELTLGES